MPTPDKVDPADLPKDEFDHGTEHKSQKADPVPGSPA